ncbi:MAG: anti-sigma F factor [bacterium]|nr:anti-sigma F factor [bacterium]
MDNTNEMYLEFDSDSKNESFARTVIAAFVSQLDPTMEEIADIKTAVSEAVTNCIIHGYNNQAGKIEMSCTIKDNEIAITVKDNGVGIEDIEQAMEPLYTSRPELERSGMGFAFMEAFMDKLEVVSDKGVGTTVKMKKAIKH